VASKPINLFAFHSRTWKANQYVYPVISRRSKGLSIGVNLNPDKVCNFDCIYCSVDRTIPPEVKEVDLQVLSEELTHMVGLCAAGEIWKHEPFDQTSPEYKRINDIAFSGDGEPTSFKEFGPACELAASVLKQAGLAHVKLVLITNATLFQRPAVQRALAFLDHHNGEIWAKLDAGSETYYREIERTSIPLQRVLDNILSAGKVRPLVIQSLFMNVRGVPPTNDEIDLYVHRLHDLLNAGCQIKYVQVYTTARDTAEKFVTPLSNAQVDAIAAKVRAIGLKAEAYYGPT
jgi:wyosine [tRNA(Phe)-imidazoG37] synthetase (radical SAM superfamily)